MKKHAQTVLEKLTVGGKNREHRLLDLMRPPDAAANDWFMHVPFRFNNALDIKRTVRAGSNELIWTQGANFSFAPGDVLYDTAHGYQEWGDALKHVRYCIQVVRGTAASTPLAPSKNSSPGTQPIPRALRSPGSVSLTISRPNEQKTGLSEICSASLTQDEFVRFLIGGTCSDANLMAALQI